MCICRYVGIDISWKDAILKGAFLPPETWEKCRNWLSSDNIPERFKNTYQEPQFPGTLNEAAYLETKHMLDVQNSPLLADDETIAQLPEAFLVSCKHDILCDHTLLYKKCLEDQEVPVNWYHVEDGFTDAYLYFLRIYSLQTGDQSHQCPVRCFSEFTTLSFYGHSNCHIT